jgi:GT2 family glycosyltransferase
MIKITIILLNWKGAQDTIDCLASIAAQTGSPAFRTIVVDNASGDGSLARIAGYCDSAGIAIERVGYDSAAQAFSLPEWPHAAAVTLIEADDNLGFCVGNNVGADYAFRVGADAALILNNDTTVAPDMVERLAEAAAKLGARTLLSPQILYHDRPDIVWWRGGNFSALLSPSYRFQGEPRWVGVEGYPETDWVSGCATLISRELFDEIGLYDPLFFIWCEEWDLSLRARSKGLELRVAAEALVYHKVGKSLGLVSPLTFFYSMRNMILLRRRYLSPMVRAAFATVYFPRKLLQAVWFSIKNQRLIYVHAFVDAISDRRGGLWKRQ